MGLVIARASLDLICSKLACGLPFCWLRRSLGVCGPPRLGRSALNLRNTNSYRAAQQRVTQNPADRIARCRER